MKHGFSVQGVKNARHKFSQREREREWCGLERGNEKENKRECLTFIERERMWIFKREREKDLIYVCEKKGESVCLRNKEELLKKENVRMRVWGRESVWVWERVSECEKWRRITKERERECVREKKRVYMIKTFQIEKASRDKDSKRT